MFKAAAPSRQNSNANSNWDTNFQLSPDVGVETRPMEAELVAELLS